MSFLGHEWQELGRSLSDEGNHDLTLAAKSSPDYDIFAASGRIQFFALSSSYIAGAFSISGQDDGSLLSTKYFGWLPFGLNHHFAQCRCNRFVIAELVAQALGMPEVIS